jgi:hypothetical protein
MVYVTPSDLGWRPYFYSWIDNYLSKYILGDKMKFVINMFEMFVDLAFEKMERLRNEECMPTTNI